MATEAAAVEKMLAAMGKAVRFRNSATCPELGFYVAPRIRLLGRRRQAAFDSLSRLRPSMAVRDLQCQPRRLRRIDLRQGLPIGMSQYVLGDKATEHGTVLDPSLGEVGDGAVWFCTARSATGAPLSVLGVVGEVDDEDDIIS